MNIQTIPFKLYSRLINNKSQFLIHFRELHIAIDKGMPTTLTQKHLFPKLGYELNKDYFELLDNNGVLTGHLFTLETALIYLQSFDTDDKIKCCIKSIVQLLQRHPKESPEFIESEIAKQNYITHTKAFFNEYFSAKSNYFILNENDFIALEKMKGACTAFELMLLEAGNNQALRYEDLSNLFACCTAPLYDVFQRVKEIRNEVCQLQVLVNY